jgi:hypothetical protein
LISVDPSRQPRWNDLDDDIYRTNRSFITDQMDVPATDIGEAVACVVHRGRAGGVISIIDGELAR